MSIFSKLTARLSIIPNFWFEELKFIPNSYGEMKEQILPVERTKNDTKLW